METAEAQLEHINNGLRMYLNTTLKCLESNNFDGAVKAHTWVYEQIKKHWAPTLP